MDAVRLYAWLELPNFGDALSQAVVEWALGEDVVVVERAATPKLLAVGSILQAVKPGDVVWGAGVHPLGFEEFWRAPLRLDGVTALATRGPLSRDCLLARGAQCPPVFGDPALLLPRFHAAAVARVAGRIGLVPHYSDLEAFRRRPPEGLELIDVTQPWPVVVDALRACEHVISSSLHGLIVAEAYGVAATWLRLGFKEGALKFHDYYLASGRVAQPAYSLEDARARPPVPPPDLSAMADALLAAFDADLVRRRCVARAGSPSGALASAPPPDAETRLNRELSVLRQELGSLRLASFRFFDAADRPCALACVEGQAGAPLFAAPHWGPPGAWGAASCGAHFELTLPGSTQWRRVRRLKFEAIVNRDPRIERKMALAVRLNGGEAQTAELVRLSGENPFYAYFVISVPGAAEPDEALTLAFTLAPDDVTPEGDPALMRVLTVTPFA